MKFPVALIAFALAVAQSGGALAAPVFDVLFNRRPSTLTPECLEQMESFERSSWKLVQELNFASDKNPDFVGDKRFSDDQKKILQAARDSAFTTHGTIDAMIKRPPNPIEISFWEQEKLTKSVNAAIDDLNRAKALQSTSSLPNERTAQGWPLVDLEKAIVVADNVKQAKITLYQVCKLPRLNRTKYGIPTHQ